MGKWNEVGDVQVGIVGEVQCYVLGGGGVQVEYSTVRKVHVYS